MAAIALKRSDSMSSASDSNHQQSFGDLGYGDEDLYGNSRAPAGLYGSTLASLYQQPARPNRGPAAYQRNDSERSALGYGDGDDFSLVGECDGSSIRSNQHRPGRRASLSAAIELTTEPPKRNASGSRPRGRRNSMFGNNSGKRADENVPAQSYLKPSRSKSGSGKIGRRASLGYAAEEIETVQPVEPEPTPQFFHRHKKGASPGRKGSADKNDPRTQHLTSQMRPGGSIKRPKGGNRRASMSAAPLGGKVGVGHSSSDEEEEGEEGYELFNRVTPPRSSSYGNPRKAFQMHQKEKSEVDEYGYEIDPHLPPPPPPSGPSKRAMQNRRGSTGAFVGAFFGGRRASTASSVATSTLTDITDIASNRQSRRTYSPEPDLLSDPLSTPQQEGKPLVSLSGVTPGADETPLQSNRKTLGDTSLNGTLGDSNALLDDLSMGMDASNTSHNSKKHHVSDNHSKDKRSSTRVQRASLVKLEALNMGGKARGSALGFNPYGKKSDFEHSESEDSEEEEEEILPRLPASPKEEEVRPQTADPPEATKTHIISNNITAETIAAQSGTATTEEDDEDHSDGSMTSEAPQEGAPKIPEDDEKAGIEDIGATGDWSKGAQQFMYETSQKTKKNSLLDRYPGSIDDSDDILGYDYTHSPRGPMDAYDDENERRGEEGDISDLYAEDYSSSTWREGQSRSVQSMEFTNMEELLSKAKNNKQMNIPKFIPAHGCTNASDYIVRAFVARLRAGVTVTKHSRSRWCKSHDRILHILPTGYHVTWIPETEEEAVKKSVKKPPTKLDLTKCREVRHAWTRDPKATRYTGTSTLRSKCEEGTANKSFALVYSHRTIDFTAASVDQCKLLMEGFSALCFRLQMAKLEQRENDDDTHVTGSVIGSMMDDDDSTTGSITATNMSAPWGL